MKRVVVYLNKKNPLGGGAAKVAANALRRLELSNHGSSGLAPLALQTLAENIEKNSYARGDLKTIVRAYGRDTPQLAHFFVAQRLGGNPSAWELDRVYCVELLLKENGNYPALILKAARTFVYLKGTQRGLSLFTKGMNTKIAEKMKTNQNNFVDAFVRTCEEYGIKVADLPP